MVEGYITGLHKSPFHGFSVEFAEHRQYRQGDDIRHIDWGAYARSGKYYIKQYEEETNLRSVFAIDSSKSMDFKLGGDISKFEYAIYITAALSTLLIKQRDAVGIGIYGEKLTDYLPPASKPSYLSQLIDRLSSADVEGGTSTAEALGELASRIKRRSMVVIISDLMDETEGVIDALKHFRYNSNEVILFHLLDPRELDFEVGNYGKIVDMESGSQITTQPNQIKSAYQKKISEFNTFVQSECHKHAIDYNLITTDMPFDNAMRRFFSKRNYTV
ncbi:MAG: DUF58 domain-containing protein [Candidatus Kapaibacteriales bacterium]